MQSKKHGSWPPRQFQDSARTTRDLQTKPSSYWLSRGEKSAIEIFKKTTALVPAYRNFLKRHKVNPKRIRSTEDFSRLPFTSKEDYLKPADYASLFPKKDVTSAVTISATSGSTGEPFYFPRNEEHDDIYLHQAELFLKEQFHIDKKKTLAVIGFGLGVWIGGIFTYRTLERLSAKGYPLSTIPTGTSKEQFLRAVKKFGKFYDQIILMGYPPFIKDVLDEGKEWGIKWGSYDIKILTAAEGYSEKFREYIAKKANIRNMFTDIVNMYGTVELGTMAHETALANLIRHLSVKNKKLFKAIFPEAGNVPTLCQYHPEIYHFEEVLVNNRREVVGSGYGTSIPLVRYRFKDLGGVITFEEMMDKLVACGIDLKKEMKRYRVPSNLIWRLPFVYVWARSDLTVVFRGANIYPEEVRQGLDDYLLTKYITGRFTMVKKENRKLDPVLEINIELRKGARISKNISELIKHKIITYLCETNSEFNYLHSLEHEKVYPVIVLWPYNHPLYFSHIGKQRWSLKDIAG